MSITAPTHNLRLPLAGTPLDDVEQQRLLALLGELARFLGAPGDWGYETQIGKYTIHTLALYQAIRMAPNTGGAKA